MAPATAWLLLAVLVGSAGTIVALGARRSRAKRRKRSIQFPFRRRERLAVPLVAGVAHDINNALLPIVSLSDALSRTSGRGDGESDGDVCQQAALIYRAAVQASALTHKLLCYALIESTTELPGAARHLVDLKALLRDGLRWLGPFRPRDVELDVRLPADVLYVSGNPHGLLRVILNLGTTAMSAVRTGGQLRLELRRQDPSSALLEVEARTVRGRRDASRRGLRTAPTGEQDESRLIVEAHGGSMQKILHPKTGFTFRICLPVDTKFDSRTLSPDISSAHGGQRR